MRQYCLAALTLLVGCGILPAQYDQAPLAPEYGRSYSTVVSYPQQQPVYEPTPIAFRNYRAMSVHDTNLPPQYSYPLAPVVWYQPWAPTATQASVAQGAAAPFVVPVSQGDVPANSETAPKAGASGSSPPTTGAAADGTSTNDSTSSVFPPEYLGGARYRGDRVYLKGEFLMAWGNRAPLSVPLLTVGNAADLNPGVIGSPSTGVLFGGDGLQHRMLTGFRAEAGMWIDADGLYSADISGLVLSPARIRYQAASNGGGAPVLARPIINADTGGEAAFLISLPNAASGTASIDSRSDFWGIELNARRHAYWYEAMHAQCLFGFRTLTLREKLAVDNTLTDLNGGFVTFKGNPLNAGDQLYEHDSFQTRNQFYGLQVGAAVGVQRDAIDLNFISKLGVGINCQESIIDGATVLTSPGLGNDVAPGGINALVTNMGTRQRTVFGLVPEFGANVGVQVCKHVRLQTGYSFLFWNDVLRPGSLIDRSVNPGIPPASPVFGNPGPSRPGYVSEDSTYLLHTFNFAVEVHF